MRTAAFLVLFASVTPAVADWQNTTWGSTKEEVAQKQRVRDATAEEARNGTYEGIGSPALIGTYQASGMQLTSYFLFNSQGKLSGVNLSPRSQEDALNVLNILRNTYGPAVNPAASMSYGCKSINEEWQDKANSYNVSIRLYLCLEGRSFYNILYLPLYKPGQTGF